jgi:uncharacterized membrane protein YjjB (DUF3815 family)
MTHPIELLWAALGTLGFALLFDLRPRDIPIAILGSVLGWGLYSVTLHAGSVAGAYFIAATAIGLCAEVASVLMKRPASLYIIGAILPIVPGSGMYQTMLESVRGNLSGSLAAGFQTLIAAGAIAAGLAVSSALARLLLFSRFGSTIRARGIARENAKIVKAAKKTQAGQ